jgi:hypothetical protein
MAHESRFQQTLKRGDRGTQGKAGRLLEGVWG